MTDLHNDILAWVYEPVNKSSYIMHTQCMQYTSIIIYMIVRTLSSLPEKNWHTADSFQDNQVQYFVSLYIRNRRNEDKAKPLDLSTASNKLNRSGVLELFFDWKSF